MRNWLINTEPKEKEYYKGLEIKANTGLHEQVMLIIERYLPKGNPILDVGAGSGAFSLRLNDNGYKVSALEIENIQANIPSISVFRLDINKGIKESINTKFPAVCCMEVIEHIENPWQLLRDIHEIVEDSGYLFLTTPNITSFLSRLHFLYKGVFTQFQEADLEYGHINPLSTFEIKVISEMTGWKIIEIIPCGYLPVFDFTVVSFKRLILNILRGLSYLFVKGEKRGWVLAFVLEKI